MPSTFASDQPEVQDSQFDMAALGPKVPGSTKMEHIDRGDVSTSAIDIIARHTPYALPFQPRYYVPMSQHPYLMQDKSKIQPESQGKQWQDSSGNGSLCCN